MRIVPFGSRARGKATILSDFVFLIIIKKTDWRKDENNESRSGSSIIKKKLNVGLKGKNRN
jgi:predicted nucleotidyltransferase